VTLVNRLSATFLGALGVVLVGFSVALYVLASVSLNRALDDRLEGALATLALLAEDEPTGLIWERDERQLSLGLGSGHDHVRWRVVDNRGTEVDRSVNLGDPIILEQPGPRRLDCRGEAWRVVKRGILSVRKVTPEAELSGRPAQFVIAVGLPLEPVERPLWTLAVTLPLLSTTLWGLTALIGRRLCRKALAPLTRMADTAREIGVAEPWRRLPRVETGDEVDDLARSFNGLLDRLHEALERQSRFAGDASHQLRTPLTALIGQADVALRRDRPSEEYRQTLARVRGQAERLRQIVESLLFLARADAEAGLPSLQIIDLNRWTEAHLSDRAEQAADLPGPRLTLAGGPAFARIHPALLAEVLDNLLDNAREHGGTDRPAEVFVGREHGAIRLEVRDHGRGIAPADLARVFEPFYRSAEARRSAPGGVGLGLAVAHRIVRSLGGLLEVESRPGEGCRFVVTLPEVIGLLANQPGQALLSPFPVPPLAPVSSEQSME
jgi:signal transduction histidine kinase